MTSFLLLLLYTLGDDVHTMDVTPLPRPHATAQTQAARDQATLDVVRGALAPVPTTLFVNFDGIDLGTCNPSNSKQDCHWYNNDEPYDPFSGTLQTKVAILQAIRNDVAAFGIRVTGVRPEDDENYTMIVYGGIPADEEALGSAPAGDCYDTVPNQIGFAFLDGVRNTWVNGGATVSLHEAAHTWGLDHIDFRAATMYPSGGNGVAYVRDACERVVAGVDLTPGPASCPEINNALCENDDRQNTAAVLSMLFGPPYVDGQSPVLTLREPTDGAYFQAPANFDVQIDIDDDLHPQQYTMWAWLGDDGRPEQGTRVVAPGLNVTDLTVGTWSFHVVVADEAGNESRLDFDIEVGLDPPPAPSAGCSCNTSTPGLGWWLFIVPFGLIRRRRR